MQVNIQRNSFDNLYQIAITGTGSKYAGGPYKLLDTESLTDCGFSLVSFRLEHLKTGKIFVVFKWDCYCDDYFSIIDFNTGTCFNLDYLKNEDGEYDRFKIYSSSVLIKDIKVELHRAENILHVLRSFRQIGLIY